VGRVGEGVEGREERIAGQRKSAERERADERGRKWTHELVLLVHDLEALVLAAAALLVDVL